MPNISLNRIYSSIISSNQDTSNYVLSVSQQETQIFNTALISSNQDTSNYVSSLLPWNSSTITSNYLSAFSEKIKVYEDKLTISLDYNNDITNLLTDLFLWCKFDGNFTDSSSNMRNITSYNSPTFNSNIAINNSSVFFDGNVQYLTIPATNFGLFDGITFSAWVYFTEDNRSYERVFDFANGAANNNILVTRTSTTNSLEVNVFNGATKNAHQFDNIIVNNTWMHICWTLQKSPVVWKVYFNSVLKTPNTTTGTVMFPNNVSLANCYIAKSAWNDAYFKGYMADFRIHSRTLTAEEVNILYTMKFSTVNIPKRMPINVIKERKYPPAALATTVSTDNTTSKVLSGQIYGNGTYLISWSSDYSDWRPSHWFDGINSGAAGGHFAMNTYNTSGLYTYTPARYIVSDYIGEWIKLTLPVAIYLKYIKIYQRSGNENRSPINYRIYGTNNGTTWTSILDVTGASYTSLVHQSPDVIDTTVKYTTFALVVNKIGLNPAGNNPNWDELEFYGYETYSSTTNYPIAVLSTYFTSNQLDIKQNVLTAGPGITISGNTISGYSNTDYNSLSNKPVLFDGDYNSLTNKLIAGSNISISSNNTISAIYPYWSNSIDASNVKYISTFDEKIKIYENKITFSPITQPQPTVIGGTINQISETNYYYAVFTSTTGTNTIYFPKNTVCDVFMIGGGGGGGYNHGGGGGAGAYFNGSYKFNKDKIYNISVGSGGTGGISATVEPTNGNNTIIYNSSNYNTEYLDVGLRIGDSTNISQPSTSLSYSTIINNNIYISNGSNTVSVNGKNIVIPAGYQYWTVPFSGNYKFVAAGARGLYKSVNTEEGRGAVISSSILLKKGDILVFCVGKTPLSASGSMWSGGGGTFISQLTGMGSDNLFSNKLNHRLLLVAGGGGGAGTNTTYQYGVDASLSTSGTNARNYSATVATNGGGGGANGLAGGNGVNGSTSGATQGAGSGGGGYIGNGGTAQTPGANGQCTGGNSFLNGGLGGVTPVTGDIGTYGGFGCGGGSWNAGGGGGGYSGGNAANATNKNGGGGGGCYDINNLTATRYTTWNLNITQPSQFSAGYCLGNGFIYIEVINEIELYALGGGGGGNPPSNIGKSGGCGGGGNGWDGDTSGSRTYAGGSGNNDLTGTLGGFGYSGGIGINNHSAAALSGGGGGGCGSVGLDGTSTNGGNGGNAIVINIKGVNEVYGGGGGAGCWSTNGDISGTGGGAYVNGTFIKVGGDGATYEYTNGSSGIANTGSGGGSAKAATGGSGGSGIVIIRWSMYFNLATIDDTNLTFGTNNNARMIITNNGNIGIGTSNPQYSLDVNGTLNCTSLNISNVAFTYLTPSLCTLSQKTQINSNIITFMDYINPTITNGTINQITGTDYYYAIFTDITSATKTIQFNVNTCCDILIVGGGGSGGFNGGGGGGAGGVIYIQNMILNGGYNITVGAGGTYTVYGGGKKGGNTTFGTYTAYGGGGGRGREKDANEYNGGSGGGGGSGGTYDKYIGGISRANQGFNGGDGVSTGGSESAGGGGGGAGSAGTNGINYKGGNGGDGIPINITGVNIYYSAGGSGGDTLNGSRGTNGIGYENYGSGGQGARDSDTGGESGKNGVVIIRWCKSARIKIGQYASTNARLSVASGITSTGTTNLRYFNYDTASLTTTNTSITNNCAVFDSSIWVKSSIASSSDIRIKKNIKDIEDNDALNKILSIEPKTYDYVDQLERGTSNVYGFIAQQIKEVIPNAVKLERGLVPNIYSIASCEGSKIYLTSNKDISDILSNNIYLKTIDETGNENINKIVNYTSNSITIDNTIGTSKIFVYGTEIKDFHTIDKSYIYTLNVCATQILSRKVDTLQQMNNILKQKNEKLKQEILSIKSYLQIN